MCIWPSEGLLKVDYIMSKSDKMQHSIVKRQQTSLS